MPKRKFARPTMRLAQGRTDWFRITAKAGVDTAQIYIYDEIGYWGTTASDFVRELQNLDVKQVDLHINSPGGDVFDALAIYQALKDHSASITTYIDGLAASAASFIAMAGDQVLIGKFAQMMIHRAMGICIGNAGDMRECADWLDTQTENIAKIYADKAGGEVGDWVTRMGDETWYNADEAVSAGLADKINGAEGDDSGDPKVENKWDLSIFNYQGRSKAPTPPINSSSQEPGEDEDSFLVGFSSTLLGLNSQEPYKEATA